MPTTIAAFRIPRLPAHTPGWQETNLLFSRSPAGVYFTQQMKSQQSPYLFEKRTLVDNGSGHFCKGLYMTGKRVGLHST